MPRSCRTFPQICGGVTDVRWNSGEPASFDRAIEKIVSDAKALFSELGLGWWAIRFDNTARPGRVTYGVFEITAQGGTRIARYGNTYYAESRATKRVKHRHRIIWDSQTVAFSTAGEGQAHLVVFADVTSQAPPDEPDEEARKAPRLQTLFELHETDQGELYRGSYFDVQGLSYYGLVVARRLGNCGRDAAMQVAKTELSSARSASDRFNASDRSFSSASLLMDCPPFAPMGANVRIAQLTMRSSGRSYLAPLTLNGWPLTRSIPQPFHGRAHSPSWKARGAPCLLHGQRTGKGTKRTNWLPGRARTADLVINSLRNSTVYNEQQHSIQRLMLVS